jgi:hypothetical protein
MIASSLIKTVLLVLGAMHVLPFQSLAVTLVIDNAVLSYVTYYELPFPQPFKHRRAADYGMLAVLATIFAILGFINISTWVNLNQVRLPATSHRDARD